MSFEKRVRAPALFFLLQTKDTRWLRVDRKESHSHPPCKETGPTRLWMKTVFLIETLFLVNIRKILYNNKAVSEFMHFFK
ncbi:hypothetical protein GW577_14215 [Bacillus licheniformis]|nr:hypothetical protein [Bacillus licheniformis]OKA57359.1 hypothetical protein BHT46_02360 [Bacillus licheniformis]